MYVTSSVRVRWYGISSTLVADYLDINNDRKDKMCHDLLWRWILRIMVFMELHFLGEKTYHNNQVRNFRMICYDKKILERHIVSMNGVYDCWRFVYGNVYHKPVVWTHLYSLSGMIIKGGEDITCFNFIQIIIFYLWNIITKLTILINIIKLKVYIPVD